MDIDLIRSAEQFHNRYRRNRIVRKLVSILACVVVFSTTYALILPAITMERETLCGLAEHQHTESCYTRKDVRHLACGSQSLGIHTHTAQCADGSCGYADFVIHEHNSSCYEDGKLVCSLPEVKAHTHTDDCYRIPTWEESGHTHTDECYTMTKGLSCGKTETEGHTHTDACRSQKQVLSCDTPESDGHHHGEGCYDENDSLTCTTPESSGHHHDASCYRTEETMTCDKEESEPHTHTDACYAEEKTLICTEKEGPVVKQGAPELACTMPEIAVHEHSAACFDADNQWICGKTQVLSHAHTDACFETVTEDVLTCDLEEHEHTEDCNEQEEPVGTLYSVMLLDDETDNDTPSLPVAKLSGSGTTYNPNTDLFITVVRIDFKFNAAEKAKAGVPYTYTYPAGIEVPDDIVAKGAQDLYDGTERSGTRQFFKNADGTYSVQIIFDEAYINKSGDTVTGFVQFEGSFSKDDMNEDGNIVIGGDDETVFINGDDITYPKDETESYDIDVSKSGSWVQDGDKLVYTVYVRTTKGTPNSISFADDMSIEGGLTLGEPVIVVERGTSNYYLQWDNTWKPTDNNNWSEVSGTTHSYSSGTLTMSLPGLSAAAGKDSNNYDCIVGDVYRITYTYPITDQTTASVSPKNRVTVSAEDTTKGQTVTDSAESTVEIAKDFSYTIDKTGAVASDKPGYIKWAVTVNKNAQDLVGAKLTDDMLGLVQNAQDIKVSPSDGANINRGENNKITDITFSAVENGVNKNQYTITYYTPVEESWDGSEARNKATLDPKPDETGDEKEATADVTVSGVQLNKRGSHNAETNKLDWVITVNSGNLDIAGATLTDDMFVTLSDSDFTIQPTSGYEFTKDADGKITGITFKEVSDGKNTQSYTIEYSTEIPTDESGRTSVTNTATLSPGEGKTGKPIVKNWTVTLEKPSLSKSGNYSNGVINWTVAVNGNGQNIAGAVLTDSMLSQLVADQIAVKDANWQTIPSSSGQFTINTDAEGKVTNITFNQIGDTGVNTNKYVVTYQTDALPEWSDRVVSNEASLSLNGTSVEADTDVTVYGDGSVAKSAETGTVSEDGKTLTIPWTVTLNVPKGGLAADTTIEDDVTKNQWGNTNTNQWMTRTQVLDWAKSWKWLNDAGNVQSSHTLPVGNVTFLASDGNTYTCKQIQEYESPAEEGRPDLDALTYTKFTVSYSDGLVPPENATKLTFTYSTTADLAKASMGQNKFYNYVNAGGKETEAEYIYYKAGVIKTDGNWSTNKTYVSNEGALTWKVKAVVGEGNKKLTLSDTLPEGVTLESLQLTGWGNLNMELTTSEDGTISGTDSTNQYTVKGTYNDSVIILNITPMTDGNSIQTGAEFTLTVGCQVTDAENQAETKSLTNTVTMKLDEGGIGSSSQTQEWTYKYVEDVTKTVSKSGQWDNTNRIIKYAVVLNQEGKDLVEGVDTLELRDTMTYTNQVRLTWPFDGSIVYSLDATLIQSSVKLYRAVKNPKGEWAEGEPIIGWSWTYDARIDEWQRDKAINTITATGLPDETPLLLQYSYRITTSVPDKITVDGQEKETSFELYFSNKVNLVGTEYSQDHTTSGTKWEYSSDSAGVTTEKSYSFTKVEKGNYNKALAGATFSVWRYNTTEENWECALISTTDESGSTQTDQKTYTTDNNGIFRITRQEKNTNGTVIFSYDTNTLYKVVETAPPEGYRLPDTAETYYFYFSDSADTEHVLPSVRPDGAVDLSVESRTAYVENVKNTTEITVEKFWKNHDGTPANTSGKPAVTINLYQTTTQGSSSGGGSGGTTGGTQVNITAYGNGNAATSKLNVTEVATGSKIRIKLELNYAIDAGWNWTPTVTVTGVNGNATDGWILADSSANGKSTYTYEGQVTGDVTISYKEGPDKTNGIYITVLEQPTISDPDETGDNDPPTTTEDTPYRTVTLNTGEIGWSYTFEDLPLTGTDEESGSTVTYYYYVKEISVPNYTTSYDNNGGIQSGTITVTNTATDTPEYTLPETGGGGTEGYTLGGFVLTAGAALWLLCRRKRRREAV